MSDTFRIKGIVRASEIPQEWSLDDFKYYWCDLHDADGNLIRRAAMRERERLKYAVYEAENLITTNGINNILTMLSSSPGSGMFFSQILSLGNGAISGVSRADTSVAGEGGLSNNRKAAAGFSITGSQTDIAFVYPGTDGQGALTNIGLYGQGANTTDGTGTLQTHALYSYSKPNATVTFDYLLTCGN